MSGAMLKLLRWLVMGAIRNQYEKSGKDVAKTAQVIGQAVRIVAPRSKQQERPKLHLVKK
jgi:hypothetical protein